MAKRRGQSQQQPPMEVSLERNGKTYTGTYTVTSGIVTVEYDMRRKATQEGGTGAYRVARLLLSEMVSEKG